MGKEIHYIDYYVEEKRQGTLGFLRVETEKIEIVLRNVPLRGMVERNIYLINDSWQEKQQLGKIALKEGIGQVEIVKEIVFGNAGGKIIQIPITNSSYGMCVIKDERKGVSRYDEVKQNKVNQSIHIVEDLRQKADVKENIIKVSPIIELDKWKQIYKSYPNVHIFPQTQSVLIKPEDMVILNRDYHGLATNSFLLHAYYNYRQLLLIQKDEDKSYYLGIPGVYYERERQLAMLYGFDKFENGESGLENGNRREAYAGCFGYYMVQVDI